MAAGPMHNQTTDALGEARPGPLGAEQLQLLMARGAATHPNGGGLRPRVGDALRRYRAISMGLAVTDAACIVAALLAIYQARYSMRSEEHTSELQSHSDLVCRLLLEKK